MTNKLTASYLESQNKDGWWPYVAGHDESVEATAWCAMACRKNEKISLAALKHLIETQNQDGGWSTAPNTGASDWSTAAAVLTLNVLHNNNNKQIDNSLAQKVDFAVEKGCEFLIGLRTDIITDVSRVGLMILQGPNFDYPRGWPWEPNTYHWVEPTSYAILAIKTSPFATEKRYKRIVTQAQKYLLEKTCKPAGWNFGSPRTLGSEWPALPSPTSFALIALQDTDKNAQQMQDALDYLCNMKGATIESTIADSLCVIARNLYGDDMSHAAKGLIERFEQRQGSGENLCAIAAATIAANLAAEGN